MSDAERMLSLIRERRSARRFQDRPVSREMLSRLIDTASYAPSAGNRQDWLFTVVTSAETRLRMAEAVRKCWRTIVESHRNIGGIEDIERYAANFGDFSRAPAVILVSYRAADALQTELLGRFTTAAFGGFASAAMAAQNLMLAAHALGLGSCCMTGALAASAELAVIAGLGRRQELVCIVALGYPDESPPTPARKPSHVIARFME